ncbi:MAG: type I restriction endonuclease subunit R [Desulfamplus sp.]|nr:type I restriction endonuclease subunit R [Desulfamplus sp.]
MRKAKPNDEEHKYTEENMNPHDAKDIKKAFESDKYRILIVANKFQTGFDQRLLHTMYVEKKLGGVATVQTLSRLNRKAPNKHDTMVLDFVNDHESVKADFQDYYQSTMLDKGTDGQKLYNLKFEIEQHNLFTQDDIEKVINLLVLHEVKADNHAGDCEQWLSSAFS